MNPKVGELVRFPDGLTGEIVWSKFGEVKVRFPEPYGTKRKKYKDLKLVADDEAIIKIKMLLRLRGSVWEVII